MNENKSTLATNELSLENTICKAGEERNENAESKKIRGDSLPGDNREEGIVSTPK
jgi:hypothetical protein